MLQADGDPLAVLRSSSLFLGVPEAELQAIAPNLRLQGFAAEELIIREGEDGDACYLIRAGRAAVVGRDLIGQEVVLATFGPGACFGEVALVTAGKRTATVRAVEPVEAYVLRRADFQRLEQACPAFAAQMRRRVDLLMVDGFLRTASPFAHLPDATIRRLALQMQSRRAQAGEVIIRQGDEGDRFYLLRSGRVEVLRNGRRVQVLEAGDCFGEVALLTPAKRTATVRALEAAELLSLSRDALAAVVQEHATLRRQFAEFIRIRVGDTLARTVAAADPLAALMPDLPWRRRRRYWRLLLSGIVLLALLSVLATQFQGPWLTYAALVVGAFLGPVVYVTYLGESHLLPGRPVDLLITSLLAAGIGIPLAFFLETWLGARAGALGPALLVGLVEEPAKVRAVFWLLRRSTARFEMDGVVLGAAAGMGFAALENLLYGLAQTGTVHSLLSVLWLRTLLSPFGHGTWTALICAAIWRRHRGSALRRGLRITGAFGLSVLLHGLWDWQPVGGVLLVGWLVTVGVVGLVALGGFVEQASRETLAAVLALNPEAAQAGAAAPQATCRVCGQVSPPGTHYCARCGAGLRVRS